MASYAILPAAGISRRMGGPCKLSLPWPERASRTVLEVVADCWFRSQVDHVVIVLRAEQLQLRQALKAASNKLLLVESEQSTRDMKESIWLGLRAVETFAPCPKDRILVGPADVPGLRRDAVNRVLEASRGSGHVVAPDYGVAGGKRRPGHPISFSWEQRGRVFGLPEDRGLDLLIQEGPVDWVNLPVSWKPRDIDTMEDYRNALRKHVDGSGESFDGRGE